MSGSGSALIGQPPANMADTNIIRGILIPLHAPPAEIENATRFGLHMFPPKPAGYIYETQGPRYIGAMIVMIVFMFAITAGRLYIRYRLQWGLDDYVIIPAVAFAIANSSLILAMVNYGGLGKHVWDITYREIMNSVVLNVFVNTTLFVAVGLVKTSIVLFLRRLTDLTNKVWRVITTTYLFIIIFYSILALLWPPLNCTPVRESINPELLGQSGIIPHCGVEIGKLYRVLSYMHMTMDFLLLVPPIVLLWNVRIPLARKLKILFIFSAGLVSCVASVMRDVTSLVIDPDMTWGGAKFYVLVSIDVFTSVIVASLPIYGVLLPNKWDSTSFASKAKGSSASYYRSKNSEPCRSDRARGMVQPSAGILGSNADDFRMDSIEKLHSSHITSLTKSSFQEGSRVQPSANSFDDDGPPRSSDRDQDVEKAEPIVYQKEHI